MTGLLNDVMQERADRLDRALFDVDGIVREGTRRVRRRRTAFVAGAAALAVAAAVVVPSVLGGSGRTAQDADPELAAAFAAHSPSYAIGSEITIDGTTFDVGRKVRAYVQTDAGVVFSDSQGVVWSADGVEVTEIGRINAKIPQLVADGSRAGWVEPAPSTNDVAPEFAVHDQATGETVRDRLGNVEGMSDVRDGRNSAVMYALDGETAYVKTDQGAVAWDTVGGDVTVLDPGASGFKIVDVEAGTIAYHEGKGDDTIWVGPSLQEGIDLGLWGGYDLSPDARHILGEAESDKVRVFDTTTARETGTPDLDYAYFGGYEWIDDDRYAAGGLETARDDSPADILTCTVSTGTCDVVADDVATLEGGLVLPDGRAVS